MNPNAQPPYFILSTKYFKFFVGTLKWGVIWLNNRSNVIQKVYLKQLFLWKIRYLSNTIQFYNVPKDSSNFDNLKFSASFFLNFVTYQMNTFVFINVITAQLNIFFEVNRGVTKKIAIRTSLVGARQWDRLSDYIHQKRG